MVKPDSLAKHWKSLFFSYKNSPQWHNFESQLEALFAAGGESLLEINRRFLNYLLEMLHIKTPIYYSSELPVSGKKSDLVLNICRHFKATTYISGLASKEYLDEQSFANHEIAIEYHASKPPVYPQFHGEFIAGLSMLDMLLNVPLANILNSLESA